MNESRVYSHIPATKVGRISLTAEDCKNYTALTQIGIHIDPQMYAVAMDSVQQPVTTATITTPVQFLQNFLPGQVNVITAAREIDNCVGITTVGDWADEQIVQEIVEYSGSPALYSDNSNSPLADWNINYEVRTIVAFDFAAKIGIREEERASKIRISTADKKRFSVAEQLEITRNAVGFYGYHSGNGKNYGFLNDPNLPNYVTVATGATSGSKLWSLKTYNEIVSDLLTAIQGLTTSSQGRVDPEKVSITLAVAVDKVQYLKQVSQYGNSALNWLNTNFPKVRVIGVPQLQAANGGSDVFYMFADSVDDGSTDGGQTFIQAVPSRFRTLGVQKLAKGYEEAYSNATAGIMLKRPWAVYRASGI